MPERMHGAVQAEKMMRSIFVRKLFIWPRWEASVRDVLDDQNIEVCLSLCGSCKRIVQVWGSICRPAWSCRCLSWTWT